MEATVVNTFSSELTRLTIQKDLELSALNPSESMWIGVDVDSIFVSDPESIHCPAFEIKKMNYTLQYNESYVGETRIQNIPLPDSILQLKAKCIAEDGIAKWGEVVEEHVPYTTTQNINNLAQAELFLNITDNTTIVQFIRELEYLTEKTILSAPGVAEYILLSIGELEKLELDGSSAGR
ncbi:uncharacterized protein LOC131940110 [Physella acuta]|uniref:uncharacterized protein LOC131940110 n=1 Tax=Physella acuta TaxID=109671 RepID=UPI0027DCD11A|nr:uncharacterized protein LOC131940110 [Physella acuta]